MKKYILVIGLLVLIAACKKDTHNNSQQGQLTFTLNGANYNIPLTTSWDSITSLTQQGVQDNQIIFGGHNGSNIAFIQLDEMINSPHVVGFDTGIYTSIYYGVNCPSSNTLTGCHSFNFNFGNDSFQVATYLDSAAVLTITSYSTATHLMSGTFSGHVGDSYSLWLPLTNGKFTDVPFYVN